MTALKATIPAVAAARPLNCLHAQDSSHSGEPVLLATPVMRSAQHECISVGAQPGMMCHTGGRGSQIARANDCSTLEFELSTTLRPQPTSAAPKKSHLHFLVRVSLHALSDRVLLQNPLGHRKAL